MIVYLVVPIIWRVQFTTRPSPSFIILRKIVFKVINQELILENSYSTSGTVMKQGLGLVYH